MGLVSEAEDTFADLPDMDLEAFFAVTVMGPDASAAAVVHDDPFQNAVPGSALIDGGDESYEQSQQPPQSNNEDDTIQYGDGQDEQVVAVAREPPIPKEDHDDEDDCNFHELGGPGFYMACYMCASAFVYYLGDLSSL